MASPEIMFHVYRPTYAPLAGGGRHYRHRLALFIVRVRLKPEGAPRLYASDKDRQNWEEFPEEMRKCPF